MLICEYVCTSGYVYVVSVVMCQCLCAGSKGCVLRIHVERVSAASRFGLNRGWQAASCLGSCTSPTDGAVALLSCYSGPGKL